MTDSRPEISIRADGRMVVIEIETFGAWCQTPLSPEEAILLADTLRSTAMGIIEPRYSQAVIDEAERIVETNPETWRDRESML